MKLWVDDIRPAPEGYIWVKSVNEGIDIIDDIMMLGEDINFSMKSKVLKKEIGRVFYSLFNDFIIDIDHDAGQFQKDGGDYIKFLNYLEEVGLEDCTIHIHSQNPVGVENMRRIIRRNDWKEV